MVSILKASGFKNLESLQEFSTRYLSVKHCLDCDLEKIWICHKNTDEIPVFEDINSLEHEEYLCLYKMIKRKIASEKQFLSLLTEFNVFNIFDKIFSHFDIHLTSYIFTKCYIFYNWGINAFEPVIDHFEIHKIIEEKQKILSKTKKKVCHIFSNKNSSVNDGILNQNLIHSSEKGREKSIDLFDQPSVSGSSCVLSKKVVSFKSVKEVMKKNERFFDLTKNPNNPYHETFNLKNILYDMKQKPQWPRNHVLSKNDSEELFKFIIDIPVKSNQSIQDKLLKGHKDWVVLRELLTKFIHNHTVVDKNNGYGRILKHHMKRSLPRDRRLIPIPKTIVASYLVDVLRRVLPLELFGFNSVRKKFFSGLIKILNSTKEENFIWHELLSVILQNKSRLAWASQINDNYTETQIILKLFKFIVIHYVFVLIRNNFYVTETGSSGYGLRFYRKSDMESASSACLNSLIYYKHLRTYKRRDYDVFSVERKWVDTGVIDEEDLKRKAQKIMSHGTEYKQPIASVRFLPKNERNDELRLITNIVEKEKRTQNLKNQKLVKMFVARSAWRKRKLFFLKLLLDFLVDRIGFGIKPLPNNPKLEIAWKKAIELKGKSEKLYFVKADIADAFDSVRHDILIQIIQNTLEDESLQESIQLRKIIEWKMNKGRIRKAARFSFSNRTGENSIMINRSIFLRRDRKINQYYDTKFVDILKQVVIDQRIEIKGRIFKLVKGLAQGSAGKFSTSLCEIYYSSMDKLYFGGLNSTDSILLRGVDDYLLITSEVGKAKIFLEIVKKGIERYNARFNKSKLKSNLIEDIHEVRYLGLIFNFEDMSVKPNYSKYQGRDLLSTMRLNDQWGNVHFNKQSFLERRSYRLNSLKLHGILLSKVYNNLKTVRQTVFQGCLMQALRVMSLVEFLYQGKIKNDLLVFRVLLKSCNKIKNLVSHSSDLLEDEVKWLFFFAAVNIFGKRSGQFKNLLILLNFHLRKFEKKFVRNSTELLLDFLKEDILDTEHWKTLNSIFGKLRNKSLKLEEVIL